MVVPFDTNGKRLSLESYINPANFRYANTILEFSEGLYYTNEKGSIVDKLPENVVLCDIFDIPNQENTPALFKLKKSLSNFGSFTQSVYVDRQIIDKNTYSVRLLIKEEKLVLQGDILFQCEDDTSSNLLDTTFKLPVLQTATGAVCIDKKVTIFMGDQIEFLLREFLDRVLLKSFIYDKKPPETKIELMTFKELQWLHYI